MLHKFNNMQSRVIIHQRDNYTFFRHTIKQIHLVKMRLPLDGVKAYLRISSFGDSLEFAFFVRGFGRALFILRRYNYGHRSFAL